MWHRFIYIFLLHHLKTMSSSTNTIPVIHNASLRMFDYNSTIMNGTCNDCLCAMLLNTTSISAFNCFQNNKTCEIFSESLETSSFSFMNNSASSIYLLSLPGNRSTSAPAFITQITSSFTSAVSTTTANIHVPVQRLITNSSDPIVAIYNTTIGSSSLNSTNGTGTGQYRNYQGPTVCIDFRNSTCLNFGQSSMSGASLSTAGVGTGIYTIPQVGATVLLSFQFQTGGDNPNRDPLTISLEGSNATDSLLDVGSSWTLIYSGPSGLSSYPYNVTRFAWGPLQNFSNTIPYTAYRMLVTSQRGLATCTQFSEIHFFGFV